MTFGHRNAWIGWFTALLLAGCSQRLPRQPNVLLISIDSLRADHVGALGYPKDTTPAIDRLAREGALFTHAASSSSWTLPAHAALLTALPDSAHGARTPRSRIDSHLPTLAGALRTAGYRTVGFYSGPFLHPSFGFAKGFEQYIDCSSYGLAAKLGRGVHGYSHKDITNPTILWHVLYELDRNDERPFFFFVHMWDVHYDLIPPPPFDTMFDPDYTGSFDGRDFRHNKGFRTGMKQSDYEHVLALYDGEIRSTDTTIDLLLRGLQARGLLRSTMVVITADHGDEFLDHGGKGHRSTLYEELLHVPLVFWYPKRISRGRIDDVVRLIDVAPTILDLAGVAPLKGASGRSLKALIDGRGQHKPVPALSELTAPPRAPDLSALRLADEKIIVDGSKRTVVYFDLGSDPREQKPIPVESAPRAARLLKLLAAMKREARKQHPQQGAGGRLRLPPRLSDQLRSLGYLD